jgi:hypothetical protein
MDDGGAPPTTALHFVGNLCPVAEKPDGSYLVASLPAGASEASLKSRSWKDV